MTLEQLRVSVGVFDTGDIEHQKIDQGDDGKNAVYHQEQGVIRLRSDPQGDKPLDSPVDIGIHPKDKKGVDGDVQDALQPLLIHQLTDAHVQPGQHAAQNRALAWFHRTCPFYGSFGRKGAAAAPCPQRLPGIRFSSSSRRFVP